MGPATCLPTNCVDSSATARVPLPLCPLEPNCLSPTSTMSLRARALISHLDHVYSSLNARLPSTPCSFKPEHSFLTPTMFLQAQVLISHLDHVYSSPNACLPPSPACSFEPRCSSSTPIVFLFLSPLVVRHLSPLSSLVLVCSPCTLGATSVTLINWFTRPCIYCIYVNARSLPKSSVIMS